MASMRKTYKGHNRRALTESSVEQTKEGGGPGAVCGPTGQSALCEGIPEEEADLRRSSAGTARLVLVTVLQEWCQPLFSSLQW
jgi:hypothetical protein